MQAHGAWHCGGRASMQLACGCLAVRSSTLRTESLGEQEVVQDKVSQPYMAKLCHQAMFRFAVKLPSMFFFIRFELVVMVIICYIETFMLFERPWIVYDFLVLGPAFPSC